MTNDSVINRVNGLEIHSMCQTVERLQGERDVMMKMKDRCNHNVPTWLPGGGREAGWGVADASCMQPAALNFNFLLRTLIFLSVFKLYKCLILTSRSVLMLNSFLFPTNMNKSMEMSLNQQ